MKIGLTSLLLVLFFLGCTSDKLGDRKSNVAAIIGDREILTSDIDPLIQPELYESLYNAYYARKYMLEELIAKQLLREEAKKLNITLDSLVSKIKIFHATPENRNLYIENNLLADGIPDSDHPGRIVPLESEDGKKLLKDAFETYLVASYVDSLKLAKNIEVFLQPPLSPTLTIPNVTYHKLNRVAKEKPIVWIFSDFGCSHCREFYPTLNKLLQKYNSDIEFRYSSMTQEISDPILYAEYAGENAKFWEAAQLIFTAQFDVEKISRKLGLSSLNFTSYKGDLSKVKRLKGDYELLMKLGKFQATPTIVINDRIYYGDISFSALDRYFLENVLK